MWQAFECETLGDFHDIYLETDVLLLADVFENFRKTCLKHYKLDPAHYYTSPGLSWDALLKYTGVNLELLTDVNMHLFVERGLRGGISMESRRYCQANNPYLRNYNPHEETSYIMYYDANNLYGWAISQPLPVGKFAWCLVFPTLYQIRKWRPNRKIGYILEVDLEYPEELHHEHHAYPLAPEKQVVPKGLGCGAAGGQDREVAPSPARQNQVRLALQNPPAVLGSWDEAKESPQNPQVRAEGVDGAIHLPELRQLRRRQDDGKPPKPHRR